MINLNEIIYYLPPLTPLFKLFMGLTFGLFVASFLEALKLTEPIAKLTKPLVRFAHLSDISATAFAISIFSPASSNAYMGEKLEQNEISQKELIISNIFNSFPSTLIHLPSLFFLAVPILGMPALIYVAISVLAALLRTIVTVFVGRMILPKCTREYSHYEAPKREGNFWKNAWQKGLKRFLKRCPRLIYISIPIYCIIYYLQFFGIFDNMENWLATSVGFDFLKVQSLGLIVLYMAAEMQAVLIAAASLYHDGALNTHEVVFALLIGNLLSTPMRGIRHQLPAYMGYFNARFAGKLIIYNQFFRMISMAILTVIYYYIYF